METFENVLIVILYIVLAASVIAGIVTANKDLVKSRGERLSIVYSIWLSVKFFFLVGIIVALISGGILSYIAEGLMKTLLDVCLFLVASFFTYKVTIKKIYRKKNDIDEDQKYFAQHLNEVKLEQEPTDDHKNCPFEGRILAEKDNVVFGFNMPKKAEILKINSDWSVSIPQKSSFGWIDKDGGIHKGFPDPIGGKINYNATLSSSIVAKLKFDSLYIDNEKVGDLVKW